ncbi:lytic transglycosylase domain-containing protein [Sungkyunkwania multivorans]|uniref:Lytic transglycosylase domain-containing protein n=1 Tax=Sungkyunkwania multivorans TaxID=1173618 RepID=A0ABW3CX53_9FLAO
MIGFLKKGLLFLGAFFVVGILINAFQTSDEKQPVLKAVDAKLIEEEMGDDYNVYALEVPEGLNFAGELVPLNIPDVRERMDRELLVNTYWQSNGLLLIKRANKYFPIIEPILKKNGVPEDLKYLAVIESGLMQARSPAGASGFWQIMKATGRENGLEVNDNVDERYHIEKATEVACKFLKSAKEKFGSWTLAAAAYNAGRTGINRRLDEQQVDSYYDLLLGEETGRYVFRIIALKEIMTNPDTYGFNYKEEDLYKPIPTRKIAVDTAIESMADFAKQHGINYKILKLHNPWLREKNLNNSSGKTYYIEIPEKGYY